MHLFSAHIDHTLLNPDLRFAQLTALCMEAKTYQFKAVCIPSLFVTRAKENLSDQVLGPTICTVVGFPHGCQSSTALEAEVRQAILDGADELDFVIPRPWIHEGEKKLLADYFRKFRTQTRGKIIKAILETGNLSEAEIESSGTLAVEAGWDFLKTSTGYGGKGGATPDSVAQLVSMTQGRAQVKASGGIRSKEEAEAYLSLGATRIGTSSGVAIMKGTVQNRGSSY